MAIPFVQTFAFTPQNSLLTQLYDAADTMYTEQPERLLQTYQKLDYLQVKYAHNEEMVYYFEKIAEYIHGKLFTFDRQPNFVCLQDRIQKGDTVEIDYTLKTTGDQLLVTTWKEVAAQYGWSADQVSDPLAFNPGEGQVINGIDETTLGMQVGQRVGELLAPRDAYGSYFSTMVISFSGVSIPVELKLVDVGEKVGLPMTIKGTNKLFVGIVKEKSADEIVVDFNHPQAGQTINLTLEPIHLFKSCGH